MPLTSPATKPTIWATYILDKDGTPTPEPNAQVWMEWMTLDNVLLANTDLTSRSRGTITTLFLGMDVSPYKRRATDGAKLLWETRVYGGPYHGHIRRYATRAAATSGHLEVVRLCLWDQTEATEEEAER